MSDHREELMTRLKSKEIPAAIYYPKPLHLQRAFQAQNYKLGDFPVSEEVAELIFSLPMHPYLTEEEQDFVVATLRESLNVS